MSADPAVQIGPVPRDGQVTALWLLYHDEPEMVRRERVTGSVQAALQGTVTFHHLLEARRGDARVGVVWGQVLAGRNANVWPPALESGEPESTADQLLEALDERFAGESLAMAQALLPANAVVGSERLRRNGYQNVASLLYLLCHRDLFPTDPPSSPLSFIPFRDGDTARLAAIIDATYVDSRDAPTLDGARDTRDVIHGYQATGKFAPERWFFVQHERSDVGCLLLTDHPDLRVWELMYMGLSPPARGRGWGKELVRFAQWQAREAECHSLLVSVDAANGPAVTAYTQSGFSELERRGIWVKKLHRLP